MTHLPVGTSFQGRSGASWRVVRSLGSGGTAVVYAVQDENLRPGAAKLLSAHRFPVTEVMRARFAREIAHLGSIDHPNVLPVLDRAEHEGSDVLICEQMSASVRDRMDATGAPALDVALAWICCALAGTQALHDRGLVHRDLSPKNLLLRGNGTLVVADFGTVRHHDDATVTRDEGLGSMIYISPQQFEAPHGARPADDLYSLGQISWELITGRRPQGNTPPSAALVPSAPGALSDLIERMRAYDAESRPTTMSALAAIMGGLAEDRQSRAELRAALSHLSEGSLRALSARLDIEGNAVTDEGEVRALNRAAAEADNTLLLRPDQRRSPDDEPGRYGGLRSRGYRGFAGDIDFLMRQLAVDDLRTVKLVDHALGLVSNPEGRWRIDYYLFHGTQRESNYAANYFRRRGDVKRLKRAVDAGVIDRIQAFF